MTRAAPPELSILLVADSLAMIQDVLHCYREQGDPGRLELIVAALGGSPISEASLRAAGFPNVRVVDGGEGRLARAEANAVRAASARFVVFAQAHARPRPGYVDAILAAANAGPWAVIGPAIANANPRSAASRAAMRIGYAPWLREGARGPAAEVAGHNSAYLRDALLSLGDDLERVLTAGQRLQVELAARGHRIVYEPAACIELVNVSRAGWFLVDMVRQGRRFASERRIGWTWVSRLAHAAGAPWIPAVRLLRMSSQQGDASRAALGARATLALVAGLVASAAGELVGYLAGPSSRPDFDDTSLHRLRYVRDEERRQTPFARGGLA